MSDFSKLIEIPAMYQTCKATEDVDMTPLDFITDHLVNIDGLFDTHDKGDEQKPHAPNRTLHFGQTNVCLLSFFTFSILQFNKYEDKPLINLVNYFKSDYISKIFRPPIIFNIFFDTRFIFV